ncbi:amino acid ABC transporter permease [Demequina sp. B12]|uniref:amino acid ABC transporter permease n=1 Tax=Demequina sp. B12 TaxID=2992757 RepID=UPI00237C1A47|nr:amino acid ABC transporter permease [Demequina sp. B12]MDE0573382.1 amino acid ABC transporter permease [Demequina sp. B12]
MSEKQQVLYDVPGPKAIVRDKIYTVVFSVVILGGLAWFAIDAYQRGLFDDRWQVLWDGAKGFSGLEVWNRLLWDGLVLGTLKAVAIAVPIVAVLALVLTIARQAPSRWVKWPAYGFTHVFRGIPVLLIIYFGVIALNLKPLWAVVLGLVVYNTAVVAEILRAGIAALPRGQKEAGLSVGLSPLATMMRIQLPQAIRIMLPALISQIVVLLKDTSLGFIIGYVELLTVTKTLYNFFGNSYVVPLILAAAVIYITVNMAVSSLATWLEGRLRRARRQVTAGEQDDPLVAGTPAGQGPL